MKWYDKILLGFLSVAMIVLSLTLLFFAGYPFYAVQLTTRWLNADASASIVVCLITILLLAASVRLLFWLFTKRNRIPSSVLVRKGDDGTSFMTVSALNAMATRFVEAGGSVRTCRTSVVPVGDAVRILVRAGAKPDAVIPALTEELQRSVKTYMETYSGVRVEGVEIVIETTESSAEPARVS